MKLIKSVLQAFLALAALGFAAGSAQAAISYTSGDVFLGFHQDSPGNTTDDFVVKLTAGSTLRDANGPVQFTLSGIDNQLVLLFGSGWATDPTVHWGLIGTTQNAPNAGDAGRTIYSSVAIGGAAPGALSLSGSTAPANLIIGMKDYYNLAGGSAVANSGIGSANNGNSWTTNVGTSFNDSSLGPIENTVAGGLAIYRVPTTSSGQPVTLEGTLTYAGANTFAFVPEPSSAALLLLAGAGLIGRRRRRAVLS